MGELALGETSIERLSERLRERLLERFSEMLCKILFDLMDPNMLHIYFRITS